MVRRATPDSGVIRSSAQNPLPAIRGGCPPRRSVIGEEIGWSPDYLTGTFREEAREAVLSALSRTAREWGADQRAEQPCALRETHRGSHGYFKRTSELGVMDAAERLLLRLGYLRSGFATPRKGYGPDDCNADVAGPGALAWSNALRQAQQDGAPVDLACSRFDLAFDFSGSPELRPLDLVPVFELPDPMVTERIEVKGSKDKFWVLDPRTPTNDSEEAVCCYAPDIRHPELGYPEGSIRLEVRFYGHKAEQIGQVLMEHGVSEVVGLAADVLQRKLGLSVLWESTVHLQPKPQRIWEAPGSCAQMLRDYGRLLRSLLERGWLTPKDLVTGEQVIRDGLSDRAVRRRNTKAQQLEAELDRMTRGELLSEVFRRLR